MHEGPNQKLFFFADAKNINFAVIPNADVLGHLAYYSNLGYKIYFFIDEYGIIKQVWPAESFQLGINHYNPIDDMLVKI